MPKSTRSRSPHTSLTKARLKWVQVTEIDWPEGSPGNRDRAPKGTMNPAVLERILLARPTVVVESGAGRFQAVSDIPHVLRFAGTDPVGNRLIPCLIIKDEEWDLATWSALAQWIVPWIEGHLTEREKRRIRKMLKAHPTLAALIGPRPTRERAKDVVQALPQPSKYSVASTAPVPRPSKAPDAHRSGNDEYTSTPPGPEPPYQAIGTAEQLTAARLNRDID